MTAVFTDFFRARLFANQALMASASIRVVYFSSAPALAENDARVAAIQTVSDLSGQLGWSAPLTPTVTQTVGTMTAGNSVFVISNNPFLNQAGWAESRVAAAAFVYVGALGGETDPVMFITTTPFQNITIAQADSLVALPNATLANNRAVFSWPVPAPAAPTVIPVEGKLMVYKTSPSFEPSHLQHVWIYPQRVNLVANPSFEGGTNHWRTNGTLGRINTGAPGGGYWSGEMGSPHTAYLNAAVGTASTPTFGGAQIINDRVWVAKLRKNAANSKGDIATKWGTGNNYAWEWGLGDIGQLSLKLGSTDGLAVLANMVVVTPAEWQAIPAGQDFYIATWLDVQDGANIKAGALYSTDGTTWTVIGTTQSRGGAPYSGFNSATSIKIGQRTAVDPDSPHLFEGRVYWAEVRTGLDPKVGTVIWRFDAAEYPGTGTSYADPRAKTWTLTTAGAILPKQGDQATYGQPLRAESNTFPLTIATAVSGQWTIQAMVRGTGTLKVGLLSWQGDYLSTGADWGDEQEWDLTPDAFIQVWAMRQSGESRVGLVRLETTGNTLIVDNVLCEPDWLVDWPYFDGDSTYGARDDFSWYNGENNKSKTYSLWYNHRNAVIGRLFAWSIPDDDFTVTDEEVEAQGFVYGWVPAGVRVTPHIDVLWKEDIRSPVADVAGTAVTPYKTGPDDQLGVENPWL